MVHRAIMAFRPVSPSVKFPELDEELQRSHASTMLRPKCKATGDSDFFQRNYGCKAGKLVGLMEVVRNRGIRSAKCTQRSD